MSELIQVISGIPLGFQPRLCDLEAAFLKGKERTALWDSDQESEISKLTEQVSGKVDFLYRDCLMASIVGAQSGNLASSQERKTA